MTCPPVSLPHHKYKIIIATASIGGGHTKAGQAVQHALSAYEDVDTQLIDFTAPSLSRPGNLVKSAYLFILQTFPAIYGFLYRLSQKPFWGSLFCRLTAAIMQHSVRQLLADQKPDIILCTHPFPCGGAAELRRRGCLNVPVAAVITDFVVHRLWVYNEVTHYFVATPTLKVTLEQTAASHQYIQATGIPVHERFSHFLSRSEACSQLDLNPTRRTILLMGGSLGLDALQTVLLHLNRLTDPFNIIAVAGTNDALRQKLERTATQSPHQVKILGYTQEIPLLMSAADLLITKPGALTISEALVKGLPMLLYQALPGQEEDNAAYLTASGAACWATTEQELTRELTRILTDNEELTERSQQALALGCPNAANHIATSVYQALTDRSPFHQP
ncbi:MAG TPA: glycosyltransferase [Patescibacteria group bacterium]|nr:glycosyltransferase [Patescibacteria group bacterium]